MESLIKIIQNSLLNLLDAAIETLPQIFFAAIILVITRYLVEGIRKVIRKNAGRLIKSISLQLLLLQMASTATWVAGILIACTLVFPSLRLGDIVGLLGLSSVAVGFAFQDIFKNFLAGILLLLNEPFKVGDQIIVGNYEGTVEEINIRSTDIRTYQDEHVVIPNAIVFTSPVHVLTHYAHRRTDLAIGLAYSTTLPDAHQILLETVQQVEGVLPRPVPEVDLVGFGESSIDFAVRYWTLPQKIHVRRTRTQVIMQIKQACDRSGLNIPFPIRTVYSVESKRDQEVTDADRSGMTFG